MLSTSIQIRDLNPDSWYSFKNNEMSIMFDLEKPYGVDTDSSFIINSINGNYLSAKWNRPHGNFRDFQSQYFSNQLGESEFYMGNDSSLMIGRNSTIMGGLNFVEHTDEIESVSDVLHKIDTNEIREYLFQFRGSSLNSKKTFLTFDNMLPSQETYLPVIIDSSSRDTYSATQNFTNTNGTKEVWSSRFSLATITQTIVDMNTGKETVITSPEDVREITIKVVNPLTGNSISGDYKFIYDRNSVYDDINSTQVDSIYDINDIYQQPEYNRTATNRIGFVGIFAKHNGKLYKLNKNNLHDDGTVWSIPGGTDIYFVFNTPYLFNESRSHRIDQNDTPNINYNDYIMDMLGFRFTYNTNNRQLRLFDVDLNAYTSFNISCPINNTMLFYIKTRYEKLNNHNPTNGVYHYRMIYEFRILGEDNSNVSRTHQRVYQGGLKKIKYKGQYEINSIPSFDAYPLLMGNMPKLSTISREKILSRYDSNSSNYIEVDAISEILYTSPFMITMIDNIAFFINKSIEGKLQKLFQGQFNQERSLLDSRRFQYWACDSLRSSNLREISNLRGNELTSSYDLYGYIRLSGKGKVNIQEEKFHNVIRKSLYFDGDVTGNANINRSWSNNGSMSINFWIKTSQRTRGVILCDMEIEQIIGVGIYIGVAQGGLLEVGFNTERSRIYETNISNDEYRMITITVSQRRYLIYVDGVLIDTVNALASVDLNKDYQTNYNVYFMGHPKGKCTQGYIARIAYYTGVLNLDQIKEIYEGEIEHRIYGTILASNMPLETQVRFYDHNSGSYIDTSYSKDETGEFVYRGKNANSVMMLVSNDNRKYGTIQVMGPLSPTSTVL